MRVRLWGSNNSSDLCTASADAKHRMDVCFGKLFKGTSVHPRSKHKSCW